MAFHFFGNALHTRAASRQMIQRAAFRASLRRRFGIAALMALDLAAKAMLHQPARTLRALEAMTAHPAKRQRRITTTVEEEQRLLALLQRLGHAA